MRVPISVTLLLMLTGCSGNIDPALLDVPAPDDNTGEVRRIDGLARKLITPLLKLNTLTDTRAGMVVLAARDGQLQYATSVGYADVANEIPITPATRVRIASMTKPITGVAAMQLVEAGKLDLDDPVARYIPEFAELRVATSPQRNDAGEFDTQTLQRPLLVRDLLDFRSGMGGALGSEPTDLDGLWSDRDTSRQLALAERVVHYASLPLQEQPGTRWRYGPSLDVIARIIELVSGEAYEDYLHRHIFQPLGMDSTSFMPPPDERDEIATHYTHNAEGDLIEAAPRPWGPKLRVSGSGGLVSTAEDYMRFALMLFNRGGFQGVQIIKPETHALMTRLHTPSGVLEDVGINGLGWGLGLSVVNNSEKVVFGCHDGDYWWSGYYGTQFWVSPTSGLVMVYMVQYDRGTLVPDIGLGDVTPGVVQELLFRSL